MDTFPRLLSLLDDVLGLGGLAFQYERRTPLLGALPELDSIAVVALITRLEDEFGVEVLDDEIDASVFADVGSLADFVDARLRS